MRPNVCVISHHFPSVLKSPALLQHDAYLSHIGCQVHLINPAKKEKIERKKTWIEISLKIDKCYNFHTVVIHKHCYMCFSLNEQAKVASFFEDISKKNN